MTDVWDSKVLYQIAMFNLYKRILILLSKHHYHGTVAFYLLNGHLDFGMNNVLSSFELNDVSKIQWNLIKFVYRTEKLKDITHSLSQLLHSSSTL